jgi:hypothetical protein
MSLLLLLNGSAAAGFRHYLPLLTVAAGATESAVVGTGAAFGTTAVSGVGIAGRVASASAAASVTGAAAAAVVRSGAASAQAAVTAANPIVSNEAFVGLRPWLGAVTGMAPYLGAAAAGAVVTGDRRLALVGTGQAVAGAVVTGRNASLGNDAQGFLAGRPWFGVQGSTTPLPAGLSYGVASVSGEGVSSLLGDYATPPRSVFDVPPPRDFLPPGVTLDYGQPLSLRPASALSGEAAAYSFVAGQLRVTLVRTSEPAALAAVTGQARAAVVAAGAAAGGAQVSAVALGISSNTGVGASSGGAQVTGQDRSLSPGAALGHSATAAVVSGELRVAAVQSPGLAAQSAASAVDASGYPLAAPAGSASAAASVSGEPIVTIVATAAAEGRAAAAALQATLVIAQAAVSSMAAVSGRDAAVTTVVPGGRWPRPRPRHSDSGRPGTGNTRRPVSNSS